MATKTKKRKKVIKVKRGHTPGAFGYKGKSSRFETDKTNLKNIERAAEDMFKDVNFDNKTTNPVVDPFNEEDWDDDMLTIHTFYESKDNIREFTTRMRNCEFEKINMVRMGANECEKFYSYLYNSKLVEDDKYDGVVTAMCINVLKNKIKDNDFNMLDIKEVTLVMIDEVILVCKGKFDSNAGILLASQLGYNSLRKGSWLHGIVKDFCDEIIYGIIEN